MTRAPSFPRNVLIAAVAGLVLIGAAACSSDDKTSVQDLSTINATLPSGITIPGLTDDCQAVYAQFVTALASAFNPTGQVDYGQVFGAVSSKLPADLQDEVAVMTAAFQQFGAIVASNNGDMTQPAVQAAIAELSTPEVNAANETLQAYFETTCPQG